MQSVYVGALGIADGVKQFVYLSHGKGDDISTDAKDFAQLNVRNV